MIVCLSLNIVYQILTFGSTSVAFPTVIELFMPPRNKVKAKYTMKKQSSVQPCEDTFYETHLINVPLDLFSPACKEEEYGSLDNRQRKQTTEIQDSAPSAAQCANLSYMSLS